MTRGNFILSFYAWCPIWVAARPWKNQGKIFVRIPCKVLLLCRFQILRVFFLSLACRVKHFIFDICVITQGKGSVKIWLGWASPSILNRFLKFWKVCSVLLNWHNFCMHAIFFDFITLFNVPVHAQHFQLKKGTIHIFFGIFTEKHKLVGRKGVFQTFSLLHRKSICFGSNRLTFTA